MARIQLHSVSATYDLLTVRDYNLKRLVADVARRTRDAPRQIQALRSITLDLDEGTRLGLVGANGAGKSTLLAVMAGLLPPTTGSVGVEGRVLALLGGASSGLDQEATGRDNVISMGVQLGESPSAMRGRMEDIVEFSGLEARISHPVYSYSTGMQARLRFSILTALRPDVLLIDEGIGAADAGFAFRAAERLKTFMAYAGILVLASHADSLVREQCTSAILLQNGTLNAQGSPDKVLDSYKKSFDVAAVK